MRRLPAIFSVYEPNDHKLQPLGTLPRDPRVVSLHVNAGYFSTTARRVTSSTCGPPPPCKHALNLELWVAAMLADHPSQLTVPALLGI